MKAITLKLTSVAVGSEDGLQRDLGHGPVFR